MRFGRIEEAQQIYQDRITQASVADRASCIRDYIAFLEPTGRVHEIGSLYQELIASDSAGSVLRSDLASLASVEEHAGNQARAESLLREVVKQARGEGLQSQDYQWAMYSYASALARFGKMDDANRVIDEEVSTGGGTNLALQHQAQWLQARGDTQAVDEIERRLRKRQPANPEVGDARKMWKLVADAQQFVDKGEFEAANRLVDQMFEMAESDNVMRLYLPNIGNVATALGRMNHQQDAAAIMQRQLAISERNAVGDPTTMFSALINQASFYLGNLRMPAVAGELLDRADSIALALYGEESTQMEEVFHNRLILFQQMKDGAAALEQEAKLLDLRVRVHGAYSVPVLETERAAQHWQRAVEISRRLRDGRGALHAQLLQEAASHLISTRQLDEAMECIAEGSAIAKSLPDPSLAAVFNEHRELIEKLRRQGASDAPSHWFEVGSRSFAR